MDPDERPPAPIGARLHPRRAPGMVYAGLAVVVGVIVLLGTISNLSAGRYPFAAATLIVGGGVTAVLVGVSLSILLPRLDLDAARVVGRLGVSRVVDVGWHLVLVDVDEDSPRGRFRLDLGAESISVDRRTWVGFADFVLLVASTPAPSRQLTAAARREVARLLKLDEPPPAGLG